MKLKACSRRVYTLRWCVNVNNVDVAMVAAAKSANSAVLGGEKHNVTRAANFENFVYVFSFHIFCDDLIEWAKNSTY